MKRNTCWSLVSQCSHWSRSLPAKHSHATISILWHHQYMNNRMDDNKYFLKSLLFFFFFFSIFRSIHWVPCWCPTSILLIPFYCRKIALSLSHSVPEISWSNCLPIFEAFDINFLLDFRYSWRLVLLFLDHFDSSFSKTYPIGPIFSLHCGPLPTIWRSSRPRWVAVTESCLHTSRHLA